MAKRAMTLTENDTCPTCNDTGWEICPHNEFDDDDWCNNCDRGAEDTDRLVLCRTCQP
jgi:hypothetical protein